MRAKFGRGPTVVLKKCSLKFILDYIEPLTDRFGSNSHLASVANKSSSHGQTKVRATRERDNKRFLFAVYIAENKLVSRTE